MRIYDRTEMGRNERVIRWEKDVRLCVARTRQKEAGGSGHFISWFINIYVLSLTQNKMCSVHAPLQVAM